MKDNMMEVYQDKKAQLAKTSNECRLLFSEIARVHNTDPVQFEERREEFKKKIMDLSKSSREKWKNEYEGRMEKHRGYEQMLRWDYNDTFLSKFSPINEGKNITDNNPLFNIASVEEVDITAENEPYSKYEETQESAEIFSIWMLPELEESLGEMFEHHLDIVRDVMKMSIDEVVPGATNPKKEEDMKLLREEITEKARELGFGVVGYTKVDRRYLAEGKDEYAPYQNVIVLGMEMDKEGIESAPVYDRCSPSYKTYEDAGRECIQLAEFIRSKGWKAHPRVSVDSGIKMAPHGVNAGILNFGTSVNSISREYGTRLRLSCIITEAELPVDRPKDLNVEEFCSRCRMCQKTCPVKAIPREAIRHRGTYRRRIRDVKCFSSMMGTRNTCAICIKVCPFSKFGYDKCMESLPDYYNYNIIR